MVHKPTLFSSIFSHPIICLLAVMGAPAQAEDWQPITPEELALKDDPIHPGAHAVMLYREILADHDYRYEWHYERIKILTEKGRDYADVVIVYDEDLTRVTGIKARTIRPDGTVVPFKGEVFEKPYLKSRRLNYMTKTFTLPGVEVGSIIEYQYKLRSHDNTIVLRRWLVQSELTLLRGRFSIWPYSGGTTCRTSSRPCPPTLRRLLWSSFLPPGKDLRTQERKPRLLELENVPGLPEEEFMPPEDELKMQVRFFYIEPGTRTPGDFWKREGKEDNKRFEKFIGKRKSIQLAAASLVSPGDSPEDKLRKLYARAQQVRNLTFERWRSKEEKKREKLKDNRNAEQVLERGYGRASEIRRLFVALARAAGFDATLVFVSARDLGMFHKEILAPGQINASVVVVRLGDKDLYLDPSTPFAPFGLLPWELTGVEGYRLEKEGGVLQSTPDPASADTIISRKATLRLDADGTLEGTAQVAFHGQQALEWRLSALDEDEIELHEELEDRVKGWLPTGAEVEIQSVSGWEDSAEPLRVEFSLKVPGYGASAGRRMLVPLAVFRADAAGAFGHSERVHPIYFSYPWQAIDEITIAVPDGYTIEHLPKPRDLPSSFGTYEISSEKAGDGLQVRRRLVIEGFMFPKIHYGGLQQFFRRAKAGDEQHAILQAVQQKAEQVQDQQ